MQVKAFFDPTTSALSYVVHDESSLDAVVIDPVLHLDPITWRTSTHSLDELGDFARDLGLRVGYVLDTHVHADHISGTHVLHQRFRAPTGIGHNITVVQDAFSKVYNLRNFACDGGQWDRLLRDGDRLQIGALEILALHTPGHTPACMSYVIGDMVFTGDALLMPDYGTGRCDFPNGSASDLYDSILEKLYRLPDSTRVFVGHDYQPNGRELRYQTTIGASKQTNVWLSAERPKADFVRERKARDKQLAPPALILQSLQVNINAGRLPEAEDNGRSYLRMPLNFLGSNAAK